MGYWSKFISIVFLVVLFLFHSWNFYDDSRIIFNKNYDIGSITNINSRIDTDLKQKNNKFDSIFFVGDLMLARNVERRLADVGVLSAFSHLDFNREDSYVVANFEAAVPAVHKPTPDFNFQFSVSKNVIPELKRAGITHVSLANNHAFDFGNDGYQNTLNEFANNDIFAFGNPNYISTTSISFIELENTKISLIGVMSIDKDPDYNELKKVFELANKESDLQIVFVHWGNEYKQEQSKEQRELAKVFSELGADLVVGHHPHVVQGIEWINNTLVFYSLGNFIFDQYFSREVQEGLVLKLSVKDDIKIMLLPVSSLEERVHPKYLTGENKYHFLSELAKLSQEGLNKEIIKSEIIFRGNLATSSEVVIMTP